MSKWKNYGIPVSSEGVKSEIVRELKEIEGMGAFETEGGVIATVNLSENSFDCNDVKQLLRREFINKITGLVCVSANDTSDTASGAIYKVEDGEFVKSRTESSGGPSSRRNWPGIRYDGIKVSGGKYM